MNGRCSGITRDGTRCARSVESPNGFCWLHDPKRSEDRKRAASKAGKSKPNKEVADVKRRLADLADGVLLGTTDRADAAVCGQLWNTYLRALSVEAKLKEQQELVGRMEALEEALAGQRGMYGSA